MVVIYQLQTRTFSLNCSNLWGFFSFYFILHNTCTLKKKNKNRIANLISIFAENGWKGEWKWSPIKIALINNANFVMRHQLQTINFNVIHTDFTLLAKSLWERIILTSQWKMKFHVWSKCVEDMEITCSSLLSHIFF